MAQDNDNNKEEEKKQTSFTTKMQHPLRSDLFPMREGHPKWAKDDAYDLCIVCHVEMINGWFGTGTGKVHCRKCGEMACRECTQYKLRGHTVDKNCYQMYKKFESMKGFSVPITYHRTKRFDASQMKLIEDEERNKEKQQKYIICKDDDLGDGAYGMVYKAKTQNGEEYAIKKMRKSNKDKFFSEICLMKECKGPFIVRLVDIYEHIDLCMVLEFCAFGSLDKIYSEMSGRRCTDTEIYSICHDVLSALRYLHKKGIIHRDVKPANVLLHGSGVYKLGDFGEGKAFKDVSAAKTYRGTVSFMAPELMHCKYVETAYTVKADIWSFGVTVLRILNGQNAIIQIKVPKGIKMNNLNDRDFIETMMRTKCILPQKDLRNSADSLLEKIKKRCSKFQKLRSKSAKKVLFTVFLREFVANNLDKSFDSFYAFERVLKNEMLNEFGMIFEAKNEMNVLYKLMNVKSQNEIIKNTKIKFVPLTFKVYGKETKDIKIKNIQKCATSLYNNNSLFMDLQTKIYQNMNIPKPFMINAKIIKIACGYEHCLLLSQNGCLWAVGSNSKGQCAQNNKAPTKEPKLCNLLKGVKITQIAAGSVHSAVICLDGFPLTFGSNGRGQCGVSKETDTTIPQKLRLCVKHISCGRYHTLLISKKSKLFACGWNRYGQIGIGNHIDQFALSLISFSDDVIDADGGWSHSLCVLSNGNAYSWGEGANGKLGHGNDTLHNVPKQIQSKNSKFIKCFCGYAHSALLDEEHNLFTFGYNEYGVLCHSDNKYEVYKPTKVPNVRVCDAVLGDDKTFLFLKENFYDVYAQNEQLFGSDDEWIKIRNNAFICDKPQNDENSDNDDDDEKETIVID